MYSALARFMSWIDHRFSTQVTHNHTFDSLFKVCTPTGWKNLAFKEDNCDNSSVPRIDLETFKISTFGALFQFNGDLSVNLSPGSAARNVNLTAGMPFKKV